MDTFKKISGFELKNIHDDDLRKIKDEILLEISKREWEDYNKHFFKIIDEMCALIDECHCEEVNCIELDEYCKFLTWTELKESLLNYDIQVKEKGKKKWVF